MANNHTPSSSGACSICRKLICECIYASNTITSTGHGIYISHPANIYPSHPSILWAHKEDRYTIVDLPRKELPNAVYICGRKLTIGIIGTDVECAYVGSQLVFSPGAINAVPIRHPVYLMIEYTDEIYNYRISDLGSIMYIGESQKINTVLVSVTKK